MPRLFSEIFYIHSLQYLTYMASLVSYTTAVLFDTIFDD